MNKYIETVFIGIAMVIILLPYFIIEINKDKSPKIDKPEIKKIEFTPKDTEKTPKIDIKNQKNDKETSKDDINE